MPIASTWLSNFFNQLLGVLNITTRSYAFDSDLLYLEIDLNLFVTTGNSQPNTDRSLHLFPYQFLKIKP